MLESWHGTISIFVFKSEEDRKQKKVDFMFLKKKSSSKNMVMSHLVDFKTWLSTKDIELTVTKTIFRGWNWYKIVMIYIGSNTQSTVLRKWDNVYLHKIYVEKDRFIRWSTLRLLLQSFNFIWFWRFSLLKTGQCGQFFSFYPSSKYFCALSIMRIIFCWPF